MIQNTSRAACKPRNPVSASARVVAALAASSAAACSATSLRQPAEFEPQATVWMSAEPDDPELMRITAEMAEALRPHVAVKFLLSDDDALAATRDGLRRNGVDVDALELFVDPLATLFLRDGAVYLTGADGEMAVLDLKWSSYGLPGWGRHLYPDEPERAAQIAAYVNVGQDEFERSFARASNATLISSPLFLENATFEVNGKGVLLISEPLALERNPGKNRDELQRMLLAIPGVAKVIWLAEGLAQDPLEVSTIVGPYVGMGACGHTDEFVRFADASTILLAWVDDDRVGEHPLNRINRERMKRNLAILERATDQDGRPFRVLRVPMPNVVERRLILASPADEADPWNAGNFPAHEGRKEGDEVIQVAAASYLNLLIANDLVLVPSYVEDGTPRAVQDEVRAILAGAFPGRTIRFLHATALNWSGGGPHCATLSEPRPR